MTLKNKIAVVTGANSGLGAALSEALIKKDTLVYGIARNQKKLNALQTLLGNKFIPISLDISKHEELESWVNATFNKDYLPDILINNAGAGIFTSVDDMSIHTWQQMIDTNLNGMFYITSLLVPFFKSNLQSSHIINIGSILGQVGKANASAYCTSKFGVQGFSKALYLELRVNNIKVTCVNPGSIDTSFFKSSGIHPHSNMLQPDSLADTIIHILETPDNMLIDEITIRPLDSRKPEYLHEKNNY